MALSTPQCALDHSLAPWWTMDGAEPNVRAQFSRIFAVDSLGTLFVVEGGTAMRRVFHRLGAVLEDPTHPCADASCTEPMWECSHGDAVVHLQILVVPRSRASTPPMELICIFTRGGVLWTCGTTPPFDVVHYMELQMPLHSRSIRAAHDASVFLDRYDGNYSEVLQLTLSEPQHAHDDDDDDDDAAGVKLKALFRIEGRVAGLVHFPPETMGVLSRVLLSISDSGFADAWNCHTCSEVVLHSDEPLFDLASHGAPSSVLLVHGRVWIGTDRGEIMVLLPRPQSMDGIQMEISLCAREEHAHADGVGGLLCTAMGERVWSWCEVGREAHLWCLADSAAEDSTVQLIRIGSLCFPGSGMCTPICAQRSMHSLLMAVDGGSDRVCRLRCMEIVDQRNSYPPYSWNRLREVVSRFTARMESAEHGERVQESESASGEPPNSPNTNHMNGADDVYEHNLDSLLIQMERSESRLHEFMVVMQKLLHHPTQLHTLHDVVAATTEAQEASATAATKDDASEAVLHVDPHPRSGVPQRIRALISSEELVSERDHLRSHVHALHSDLEDAQQELRHLETQLSNSQALVEAKEKEVVALRRSVAALTAAADVKCSEATTTFELESQLSQCRRVIADLHRKLEHKQHHGSHASNDVCELEDQLHHYQRKESLARNIITCLLNTQNDIFSAINGIHDFQVESESAPQDQDTMLTELRTKLDKLSFLAHKRESEQYPLWVDVRQLLSSGESRAPPTTGDC